MPFCSFSEGAAMFDVTPIENMFLLEYLPGAPGDALRVYLYARMLCLHPELGGEISDMAKALSMEEDDVQEAFAYWERSGLVEKLSDRPPSYAMRMLHSESFNAQRDREVLRYKELRGMVNKLFEERGLVHEKQFQLLIDWIEDLHYTETAAIKILEFELQQPGGRKPPTVFKRADKRAIEWAEKGIRTVEDVENAIRYEGRVAELARLVATQLSLYRVPTVSELECARRWIEELDVTEQDVLDACAESVKSRAPSFAYLDSILQKRKDRDAFQRVKELMEELGSIGTRPTPEQLRQYRGWLAEGFEAETILLAAVQCAQKNMNSFEKLDWMLKRWGDAGVHTHDQARAYLADRQRVKAEAAALLKRAGRDVEPGQNTLEFYEKWKARLPGELLDCAAELARGKGNALSYMDKLLTEWERSGVTTPEAARAQHARLAGAAAPAGQAGGGARAMDYQQHSYTEADYGADFYYDPAKDYGQKGDGK